MRRAGKQNKSLEQRLLDRADNHQRNLGQLLTGALLFFTGCGALILLNHNLPPSLEQELLALLALLIAGLGLILAAVAYFSLSFLRLYRFFRHKP